MLKEIEDLKTQLNETRDFAAQIMQIMIDEGVGYTPDPLPNWILQRVIWNDKD